MKNIVVPIDFTKQSVTALENAIHMAERLEMGIILMHSLELPAGFSTSPVVGANYQNLHVQRDAAQERLHDLIKEVAIDSNMNCTTKVTYGNLSHAIKRITEEHEIGLVVMASSGKSGFLENLTGSQSYNVAKHVDCPVVVLPEEAKIMSMKHIALAGDYSEAYDPSVFEQLINIAKHFFSHIHVVHVADEAALEDEQIDIAKSLHLYLKDVSHSFHFKSYDQVKDGLIDFCVQNQVDLLAMVPRQHGLLDWFMQSSTTKELIEDMPLPLMMLQD
ncbi:hypothetical protein BFP97_15930 [Roseivirga sp. 4D4]|uniref:universal stress protein n=1 Tax=Roseivirga sp. 4D4 TaxID=1889784 RepID=UPI0008537DF9|nr:universal stress protein [Roseivirga sp. 4D4]OEK02922.1 hypothetical protein BFP97_15930 [Roseivirga sp. 4D4]